MYSEGIVLKVEGDLATIGVKRHTACDTCRAQCGGHCDKASTVETLVKNTLNAKVGDKVRLYSRTTTVLGFASLVFVLPIIITALGYAIAYLSGASTTTSGIIALLSFVITYLAIWLKYKNKKSYDTIKMYEILED